MKKIFKVEIKEVLKETFEIEAESSQEAEYIAEKGYYDGKYILDNVECSKVSFKDMESNQYMSDERKDEIFNNLIEYVDDHTVDEKDFYNALINIIGLSDKEINAMGIDVYCLDENKKEIKSLEEWNKSNAKEITDYLKIGDRVDRKLIDYFVDSLPPVTLTGEIVQIGGVFSISPNGKNTYITFAIDKPFGDWYYMGACEKGSIINAEKTFEEDAEEQEIEE